MYLGFSNKVIIVTGGSEGIGKCLIEILIRLNALVVTCSRSEEKLATLKKQIASERFLTVLCDVSKKKDCQDLIKSTLAKFARIDILINNAGMSMRAEFVDTELSVFEKVLSNNFLSTVYCTKFALPYLIESAGIIVGVSSVAGYKATPGRSAYAASKFAMNGFLESLRIELRHQKVSVITVAPGFVATNIRQNALGGDGIQVHKTMLKEKNLMSANKCAMLILEAIKNKQQRVVLTRLGRWIVWINKFFPQWSDNLLRNFYYKKNTLIK